MLPQPFSSPPQRRRRALPIAALALAAALLLAACGPGGPRLLVADFRGDATALRIVDPLELDAPGEPLAVIAHAGWDPVGSIRPGGRAVALLVLPPGRSRPATQAALEILTPDSRVRIADQLDLDGGLAWSDDARHLLVRAAAGDAHRLLLLDADTGAPLAIREGPPGTAVFPVAVIDGSAWAAEIGPGGSSLIELIREDGMLSEHRRVQLSEEATRDWAIAPDASAVAYGIQRGNRLSVAVKSLHSGPAAVTARAAAGPDTEPLSKGTPLARAAAPVWISENAVAVARWPGADGFAVPIAAHPRSGDLAVRLFSGPEPADRGAESAAVIAADGTRAASADPNRRIIGWWN